MTALAIDSCFVQEADENGEPRIIVREPRRVLGQKLADARGVLDARRLAFKRNTVCCVCHTRIRREEHAAMVTLAPPRLAHKRSCYAKAVAKYDPALARTLRLVRRATAEDARC